MQHRRDESSRLRISHRSKISENVPVWGFCALLAAFAALPFGRADIVPYVSLAVVILVPLAVFVDAVRSSKGSRIVERLSTPECPTRPAEGNN